MSAARTQQHVKFSVSRVIRADRETVFDAWVNPEVRRRWWLNEKGDGPISVGIDGRLGGRYRITQTHDSAEHPEPDGYIWVIEGEFTEFDRPNRLAFTWNVNHTDEPCRDQVVTIELTKVEEGTECVITHEGVCSEAMRRGTECGWNGMLENLAGAIDA